MASDGWIYDVMNENARLFEKESGIKVSFTIYAPDVYFRALQTVLASGEATDVFLMQSTRWYLSDEIDPQKYCIDLTNEEWTKRLKPDWLPAVSYNGHIYGLVIWDDTVGWVYTYNDKIFNRPGAQSSPNDAGVYGGVRPNQASWHRPDLRAGGRTLALRTDVLRNGRHVRGKRPQTL